MPHMLRKEVGGSAHLLQSCLDLALHLHTLHFGSLHDYVLSARFVSVACNLHFSFSEVTTGVVLMGGQRLSI